MTPTCRYGHGEMARVGGKHAKGLYGLTEMERPEAPVVTDEGKRVYNVTTHCFVVEIYKCLSCRYVEIWDEEE